MIIQKKRIRRVPPQFSSIPDQTPVVVATRVVPEDLAILQRIGFSDQPEIGDTVLPAKMGPRTFFNAEGGEIVHRDQPMETAYQTIEWTWAEFHGPYDRVERSDFRDRSYKRYPRTKIPPPSIELTMAVMSDGQRVILSPPLVFADKNRRALVERINLNLEIFGRCELFSENLDEVVRVPVRRLNWEVLRSGHWTWQTLRSKVRAILDKENKGNRSVIESRFEFLNSCDPDFLAVGTAGFAGYVVFGFDEFGRYVLESVLSRQRDLHIWQQLGIALTVDEVGSN